MRILGICPAKSFGSPMLSRKRQTRWIEELPSLGVLELLHEINKCRRREFRLASVSWIIRNLVRLISVHGNLIVGALTLGLGNVGRSDDVRPCSMLLRKHLRAG